MSCALCGDYCLELSFQVLCDRLVYCLFSREKISKFNLRPGLVAKVISKELPHKQTNIIFRMRFPAQFA